MLSFTKPYRCHSERSEESGLPSVSRSARCFAALSVTILLIGVAGDVLADEPMRLRATDLSRTNAMIEAMLRQAVAGRNADPLRYLAHDMKDIVGDLTAVRTDKPVQEKQQKVVGRLDQLIAMLEKQKSGNGRSSSRNPTKPRADSVIASGPGGQGPMIDPKAGEKQWGNLPPKQREQILQSKTDGFPAGYEAMLQSYYQRLAREQMAEEKPAETPPSPSTSPAVPKPAGQSN